MILFVIPNEICIVIARFLVGLGSSYTATSSTSWLYELMVPRHRARALNSMTLFGASVFLVHYFYMVFDDGGFYYWRISVLIFLVLTIGDLLAEIVFACDINSITYKLKSSTPEKAVKMVSRYLDEKSAIETVKEFQEIIGKLS